MERHGWETTQEYLDWEMQQEEDREAAIRMLNSRERPGLRVSWRKVGWFFCKLVFWTFVTSICIIGWLAL